MDRLRQRADFLAVANGARIASAAFVVQSRLRDDDGPIRVGFTVTRKNGTATERNRIRRRLRELVKRLDVNSMRPHSDYVLVGRRTALTRDFAAMLDDLRIALYRLHRQPVKPRDSNAFSGESLPRSGMDTGRHRSVETEEPRFRSDRSRSAHTNRIE
jgi:ribonuclease P protein component